MEKSTQVSRLAEVLGVVYHEPRAPEDMETTYGVAKKYFLSDPSLSAEELVELWDSIGKAMATFRKWCSWRSNLRAHQREGLMATWENRER